MADITPIEPTHIQSDTRRLPFPNFNAFRPFVMQELSLRKDTYPMPTISPYVRLTACTEEPNLKYAYFTLGLHGFSNVDLNIFDVTYGSAREIIGYAYDLSAIANGLAPKKLISTDELSVGGLPEGIEQVFPNATTSIITTQQQNAQAIAAGTRGQSLPGGVHPIPGIMDVTVNRRNLGSPFVATVRWQCYNRAQLEYLRNHLMVIGTHVVLEWGNQFSDRQFSNILDFSDISGVKQHLVSAITKGRKYIIDTFIKPNDGNYDFLVGTIGNFTIDFNAEVGTYQCTTTIYSIGEEMWGINIPMTYVNTVDPETNNKPTNLLDYFFPGSTFDRSIGVYGGDASLVAQYHEGWGKSDVNKASVVQEYKNFKTNKNDYQFISWKYFATIMIPEMLAFIEDIGVKNDLTTFLKFFNTDTTDVDWIGNNPHLLSVDPDVMIIYKNVEGAPSGFAGAGIFGGSEQHRGQLTSGVWLNVGMVRECFSSAKSFQIGVQNMLLRMNGATRNFWKLHLFFDDEISKYKIVDDNYVAIDYPSFYKFNVGGKGELLKIEFNSAFPPELRTQMALYSLFRSKDKATRQQLLEKYPSIGTTSKFIFSLNWTALRDIVEEELTTQRNNARSNIVVTQSGPASAPKNSDRLLGGDTVFAQAGSRTTDNMGVGMQLGNTLNTGQFLPVADIVPTRDSVNPLPTHVDPPVTWLSELTVGQVLARQSKRAIFAVGKYQFSRDTLPYAVRVSGVDLSEKFNESTQEKLFDGYIFKKRPEVGAYFNGHGSLDAAHLALAQEFASIPVKYPTTRTYYDKKLGRKVTVNVARGQSYYIGIGNNSADPARVDELTRILQNKDYTALKEYIGKGEGGYNSLNRGVASDTQTGSPAYRNALNDPSVTPIVITPDVLTQKDPSPNEVVLPIDNTQNNEQEKEWEKNISTRFGSQIIPLVALSATKMIARITKDGYEQHGFGKSNGFVAPIPTSTSVVLTMLGIGGISISDGFYVDKLPFIFEEYGCFQTTEINEVINQQGWRTSVRGVYRLLNLDPVGPTSTPISSVP